MLREVCTALRMTLATFLVAGLLYPLATTGVAQVLFPAHANGSLVTDEQGRTVGSEFLGQAFTKPAYLQPRPSAAGRDGYDAASSGGSNLGPTSKALRERVATVVARLRAENPAAAGPVPVDLATASASGLDPHVSVAAARWQVARIAAARGLSRDRVSEVVERGIEGRDWGLLGEPRVNVLVVNLALDRHWSAAVKDVPTPDRLP